MDINIKSGLENQHKASKAIIEIIESYGCLMKFARN